MTSEKSAPRVSIGIPVFNGAAYLESALISLLEQTFSDFEVIISDNASTDNTQEICENFAGNDERIRYIRQTENIGATKNFKFVLEQAAGEYFMWAAADDRRSLDFIELNYKFLSKNPDYVASTSPNGFENDYIDKKKFISFSFDDEEQFQRIVKFFEYGWVSHGIFYSLMRTNVIKDCDIIGVSFIAADWAVDVYLAYMGKINRTKDGYTIFGVNGVSNSSGAYKAFRNSFVELFVPFYRLSKYVLFSLCADFNRSKKIRLVLVLTKLNVKANFDQIWSLIYPLYSRYLRPLVRRKQLVK